MVPTLQTEHVEPRRSVYALPPRSPEEGIDAGSDHVWDVALVDRGDVPGQPLAIVAAGEAGDAEAGPDDGGQPLDGPAATPYVAPPLEPTPQAGGAVGDWITLSALSFYVCTGAPPGYQDGYCGAAADGTVVYAGMVACGYAFQLGTRIVIEGDPTARVYTCHDRGLGPALWVDVFFWDYAEGRAWRNAIGYGVMRIKIVE